MSGKMWQFHADMLWSIRPCGSLPQYWSTPQNQARYWLLCLPYTCYRFQTLSAVVSYLRYVLYMSPSAGLLTSELAIVYMLRQQLFSSDNYLAALNVNVRRVVAPPLYPSPPQNFQDNWFTLLNLYHGECEKLESFILRWALLLRLGLGVEWGLSMCCLFGWCWPGLGKYLVCAAHLSVYPALHFCAGVAAALGWFMFVFAALVAARRARSLPGWPARRALVLFGRSDGHRHRLSAVIAALLCPLTFWERWGAQLSSHTLHCHLCSGWEITHTTAASGESCLPSRASLKILLRDRSLLRYDVPMLNLHEFLFIALSTVINITIWKLSVRYPVSVNIDYALKVTHEYRLIESASCHILRNILCRLCNLLTLSALLLRDHLSNTFA